MPPWWHLALFESCKSEICEFTQIRFSRICYEFVETMCTKGAMGHLLIAKAISLRPLIAKAISRCPLIAEQFRDITLIAKAI